MLQEYSVEYIWNSLNDFWRMFEDAPVVEQLWRGYAFTINNLYYQLYQLDLSKCIHTIPYKWISDWEVFVLDDSTRIDSVFTEYPYAFKLPFGVKNVTLLRESPRETINLPAGTLMRKDGLLVTPDLLVRHQDVIYMPEAVVRTDEGLLLFPEGITVNTEKLYPDKDYIVDEKSLTVHFKSEPYAVMWSNLAIRDLEVIYDNFGCLLKFYKPDSYKYLREVQGLWYAYWNGSTLSNIEIGLNVLRDFPFSFEDGIVDKIDTWNSGTIIGGSYYDITNDQLDYLKVGQMVEEIDIPNHVVKIGGRYYRFLSTNFSSLAVGQYVENIKSSGATIKVGANTYSTTTGQVLTVAEGEYITRFTPLTEAVGVFDYINYPGWWKEYTGRLDETEFTCYFDGSPFFDTGFFDIGFFDDTYSEECLKAIFLQYFTFLVKINHENWLHSKEDYEIVKAFLFAIKPAYTHFLFEVALNFRDEQVTFDSKWTMEWNFAPTDVPCDHHTFDESYIHPNFDDDGYFDFDRERDYLEISVFGSPEIFSDTPILGFTFDDEAVSTFDTSITSNGVELTFDQGPNTDEFDIKVYRRPSNIVSFTDDLNIVDTLTIENQ